MAWEVLEAAGVWAQLSDRKVIALDRFQMNVLSNDLDRAEAVLARLAHLNATDPPLSDEELERQALAELTEDELIASGGASVSEAPPSAATQDDPELVRDRLANRAMWCMAVGLICLPGWAVGMYFLLTAAFSSGPISPAGRFRLQVASVIAVVTTFALLVMMARNLK